MVLCMRPPALVLWSDLHSRLCELYGQGLLEEGAWELLTRDLVSLSCQCEACLARLAQEVESELPF